jgi:hypothetical protein
VRQPQSHHQQDNRNRQSRHRRAAVFLLFGFTHRRDTFARHLLQFRYLIRSAPAPGDGRPDSFVKVIPRNFSDDLEAGNRTRDFDLAGKKPTDRKRVERSQRPPTDGFENRPCMRFCSTE